ncbi:hypothetical protein DPEC_G00037240 [Dallia pectoralis]|uniref:Uncharacterized protein n=1 Tax=Dallia pectoralis TaxID=75939 RepID=A0ACC2HE68_DALPE|nr:hypothetical protein DPEC_G00037240 [Dallia pectoralis]
MSRKSGKKDKKKSRNEDEYSESEEISDIVAAMEDGLVEGDGEEATPGENNRDILKAIISLKSGLYKKIDGVQTTITEVRKEIQECTGRLAHAEKRISDAEDNVNGLISKVSTLESTVKTLSDKVEDLECRSRRNNVRLVGLPEKAEGLDTVTFLEKWLPEALGMESRETLVIERAHRIGTLSNNDPRSARPRTLIMKFLNFKDKERVLKAARIKRNVLYNNEQVRLHPDLSAGVHKMQRDYDDVRKKLRDKGIHKHRIIFPARLLLTHGDRSYTFQTPAEVVHFVRSL